MQIFEGTVHSGAVADQTSRSQRGADNPYDRDDDTSFVSWQHDAAAREMLAYAARCFGLRAQQGWLRRREHFPAESASVGVDRFKSAQVRWLSPEGHTLCEPDWHDPARRALTMWVCGHDAAGEPHPSQLAFGLLLNAGAEPLAFSLPEPACVQLDSADPEAPPAAHPVTSLIVQAHAACVVLAATPSAVPRSAEP